MYPGELEQYANSVQHAFASRYQGNGFSNNTIRDSITSTLRLK